MSEVLDLKVLESIKAVGGDDLDFVGQLYAFFVQQAELVISQLATAATSRDLPSVKRLAHRLKGSAANVGATALANQAGFIESGIGQSTLSENALVPAVFDLKNLLAETKCKFLALSLIS